ncbi:hypothetical protein EGW08_009973 [Elysia chlorotica]|uniref:RRM domain-containing protein n=1 Tax=Elysia chlorotica TaxID=188477 RepID=A0A433TL20_ELYCH|nr:hypothetical protein EGW08_009973 [Elysia chlorotica]
MATGEKDALPMAGTGPKGKKKKKEGKKTLTLDQFLQSTGDSEPKSANWATLTEPDDESDTVIKFDRSVLPSAPKAAMGPKYSEEDIPRNGPYSAHLGNVSYDAQEHDLENFFGDLRIEQVRLITDNGRPRGYAYVDFQTREDLIEALTYHEREFMGRPIRVDLATTKDQDSRGPSRDNYRSNEPDRTDGDWRRRGPLEDPPARSGFDRDRGGGGGGGFGDRDRDRGGGFGDRDRDRGGFADRDRGGFGDRDRDRGGFGDRDRGFGDRDRGSGFGDRDRGSGFGDRDRGSGFGDRDRGSGFGDRDRGSGFEDRERSNRGYGFRDRDDGGRFGGRRDDYGGGRRDDFGGGRRDDYGGGRRDDYSDRRPSSRDGSADAPKTRPKLKLQPRSKPVENKENEPAAAPTRSQSIFGAAKPVDTAAREKAIEEKLKKAPPPEENPRSRRGDSEDQGRWRRNDERERRTSEESSGGHSQSSRQDDHPDGGEDSTSPPAPKLMPAPPPKENAWARKDGASAVAAAATSPSPAAAPARSNTSNNAAPSGDRREAPKQPAPNAWGRGRGAGPRPDGAPSRRPGGERSNGSYNGPPRQEGGPKRPPKERHIPQSVDEMPKYEEKGAKDFSDRNKFSFLEDEDLDKGDAADQDQGADVESAAS